MKVDSIKVKANKLLKIVSCISFPVEAGNEVLKGVLAEVDTCVISACDDFAWLYESFSSVLSWLVASSGLVCV
jgi:hypothetical protein